MSTFSINDYVLDPSSPSYQKALGRAYIKNLRPLCKCSHPGVPMYIAKVSGDDYIVKRMPNTGKNHHHDCDSFELPPELSGRGELKNRAISIDENEGNTILRLDFSLSKMNSSKTIVKTEGAEVIGIKADPKKLTIRGLLHCIYEDAGLNRWSPKMEGKRNWYVISKNMKIALEDKVSRANRLSESFFIPEPFILDNQDAIFSRHRKFLGNLKKVGNKSPMAIAIGEIKSIKEARYGKKIRLKQVPKIDFFLDDAVNKKLNKAFGTELSFWRENENLHLLTIFTFYLSESGNPIIDSISLMITDHNWIPFESLSDKEMIERLTTSKRRYIKSLRYNLKKTDIIANVLLTDTGAEPVAVYAIPPGDSEEYLDGVNATIENSNLASFVWNLNDEEAPDFPVSTNYNA